MPTGCCGCRQTATGRDRLTAGLVYGGRDRVGPLLRRAGVDEAALRILLQEMQPKPESFGTGEQISAQAREQSLIPALLCQSRPDGVPSLEGDLAGMFESIAVIGRGRVGAAVAARLEERGIRLTDREPDLVLLCVPDSAISEVAGRTATGPWIAHVSGATPLAALAPHAKRFSLHPLQTFTRSRGPEQLDGAWAAVTAEHEDGAARGTWLAARLGLRPFPLDDSKRVVYHAGAVIASNYLVTLYRTAARLLNGAGVPEEALVPLMRRTIENGFELTGPIARGDLKTVQMHVAELDRHAPDLVPMYRALAAVTAP